MRCERIDYQGHAEVNIRSISGSVGIWHLEYLELDMLLLCHELVLLEQDALVVKSMGVLECVIVVVGYVFYRSGLLEIDVD